MTCSWSSCSVLQTRTGVAICSLSTKQVYNSLIDFNKHLNIYFSDIDVTWLRRYETYLRKKGIAESPYLFPILSAYHKTEQQRANRVHKVTYVARHSQATVMKKAGVSTSIIRELMGHSSERVTQIYLDSFDNEQIDDAMKPVDKFTDLDTVYFKINNRYRYSFLYICRVQIM